MKSKLLIFIIIVFASFQANAQNSTVDIMKEAYAKAKLESKKVFIKYSASWCGWCKRMDKQMKLDSTKDFFESSYVIVNLTVKESPNNKNLETPGANILLKEQGGDKAGLPFWVVLDTDGTLLEDSFNDKNQNLGCPASKEEVTFFTKILKNTSKLTDDNLAVIAEAFEIKK
ncbi:MAG: thioredoxin family protein [Flavobacteriaceae bacterium]|nr:thioredoxin family protein [Flavobacteriaceae bacterium]